MSIKKSSPDILRFSHKDMTIVKVESKFKGFFTINEVQVNHALYEGGTSITLKREIFERGNAVVLLPYDPIADKVVIIEQFRLGAMSGDTPWQLEFIAGMFGENEQPIDVAIREAKEEANLTIKEDDIIKINQFFPSPGGTSECIYMFAAKVDVTEVGGVYGLEEEGEDILVHVMSREEAMSLLAQGKITNASTIIGLQWLQLNYSQLQKSWSAL
jgi:ADP-ribose pyrophosphatase